MCPAYQRQAMSQRNSRWADKRGNVAVMFGLMATPIIFMAGSGYDYAQASRLKARLQAAVDGTSLTLCKTPLTTSAADLETQARLQLAAYMPEGATLTVPLPITSKPRTITVAATASSPVAFAGILGIKAFDVAASAQCATPMPKTFEIALVLDTTGSMDKSDGTRTKLASAQIAAKNFIDFVANNDAFDKASRMSVVPFASSVAVDPTAFDASTSWIDGSALSAYHWSNIDIAAANDTVRKAFTNRLAIFSHLKGYVQSWGWAGCFEVLPHPLNTQVDAPVSSNKDSYFVPMFAPDEPGAGTTGTSKINADPKNTSPTSNSRYQSLSPATQYYGNSYINDETAESGCGKDTMTAQQAEKRACKYRKPTGAAPTNSGSLNVPNGPNLNCTSKPLKRLTTSLSGLKDYIDTLQPLGSTNIFEGFMWGWRTISPRSVFADGSAESKTDVGRVIILLTDGENQWSVAQGYNINQSAYSSMGYVVNADGSTVNGSTGPAGRLLPRTANPTNSDEARAALDALTQTACTNAKTAGISVYTIGFSVPNDPIGDAGLAVLQGCASSKSQAYVASSSDGLIKAFDDIGKSIGKLRLTQ